MDNFFDITDKFIADPEDRVDGIDKVTGRARYAAEHKLAGMAYGVLVTSTIASGKIKTIDAKAATALPGVLAVISHLNATKVPGLQPKEGERAAVEGLRIFHDDTVYSNGQPIAIVIADTFERAVHAASLVRVSYDRKVHTTDFNKSLDKAIAPKSGWPPAQYKRGQAEAYKTAPVQVEATYIMPIETHNPMELHAIIAHWEAADRLTVYDKTQGPGDTRNTLVNAFQLPPENIKVIAENVGGAFGSALRVWPHEIAAVIAAKQVQRPVKLVLSRDQMFTMVGYRPAAHQEIGIGATTDGKLVGITHKAIALTSSYENFTEGIVNATKFLYACPNVNTDYKLLPLDVNTPIWMRGPGEATGCFALESALDELSYKLGIDPVELRIINHADTDPERNLPWSSKFLKECYEVGKEKIGWSKRPTKPGTLKEEGMLCGYGMGGGVFSALRWVASVRGELNAEGKLVLQSAVSDMGPGTATAMVMIAQERLGLPTSSIKFELGSTALPPGPTQGGSATTSSLGSAVHEVCTYIREQLLALAAKSEASFRDAKMEDAVFTENSVSLRSNTNARITFTELLKKNGQASIETTKESRGGPEQRKYSMYSYSVHFTKVHVHPTTGVIRVKEVVTVGDAGKIVSEKTARSQMIGGVVGGIGMALMEETVIDHRYGRYVNNNFADYHVPVNADVPRIEAYFVNKPDPIINPMGAKGMGEIALIGFAGAVANAVYNATGKRVRELPITLDKVI